jgi:hypothetical protein
MKYKLLAAAALAVAVIAATPAFAYTTFLLPQDFWPTDSNVTVQGASTLTFYQPGVGLQATWNIVTPDGKPAQISGTEVGADTTSMHLDLQAPGTYRISTGELPGPLTPIWDMGDDANGVPHLQARHEGDAAPTGGTAGTYQTVESATTYVTYGAPTRPAVDQSTNRHLVIHPITDPNQIVQSTGFQVEVLYDGQPLPNFSIVLYGDGDADTNLTHFVNTDATGHATLTFDHPGHYTAAVRKLVRAPAGSDATIQFFRSTLTFDVMAAEHPNVTVAPPPQAQPQPQQHVRPPPERHRAGRQDR